MIAKIDYAIVWIMSCMLKGIETVCDVWNKFSEYEQMKKRGFTLMTNEEGEEFWVGYGD
jgi:hypothetical protein